MDFGRTGCYPTTPGLAPGWCRSALVAAFRSASLRRCSEQPRRYVRNERLNVEAGSDTLVVSVKLERRCTVNKRPEPDGDLLRVVDVAMLAAIIGHLVDDILQALIA